MLDGEPRSIAWHSRGKPGCNPRATKSLHFPSRLHAFIPESPIEAQKAGVGNMTHATTINLCYYTLLVDVTKQSPGVSRLSARQAPVRAARCRHSPLGRESPGSSRAAGPPPSPDRHPVLAGGGLVAHLKGQNPGLPPHRGQRGVPAARACPRAGEVRRRRGERGAPPPSNNKN